LVAQVPLGAWLISRYDGERQLYLTVRDEAFDLEVGASHRWDDSLCTHMVSGDAPYAADDVHHVAGFAEAAMTEQLDIGAYLGAPIRRSDGALFGTLFGLDPQPRQRGDELAPHVPVVQLLARLLGMVLEADLERVEVQRRLERAELAANTDGLTGLWNRRGWEQFLQIEERRHKRFGDPAAVVVVDLDRLKEINDELGHAAGDDYRARAAQALREVTRATDVVARLGGDEFGIIASHTGLSEISPLLERIEAAFAAVDVSASVGAAPYLFVGGFQGAWERADSAMYDVKRQRRLERSTG
jgi:diguanylate cyclase